MFDFFTLFSDLLTLFIPSVFRLFIFYDCRTIFSLESPPAKYPIVHASRWRSESFTCVCEFGVLCVSFFVCFAGPGYVGNGSVKSKRNMALFL
jgi:hypothetical protein